MSSKLPSTVEEIQKATPLITISEPEKMQQIMPVYTDKAISVVKFKGVWGIVVISFNSETGACGEYTFHPSGPNRSEAIERFKVKTSELKII